MRKLNWIFGAMSYVSAAMLCWAWWIGANANALVWMLAVIFLIGNGERLWKKAREQGEPKP